MTLRAEALSSDVKTSLKWPAMIGLLAGALTACLTLAIPDYYRSEACILPVESKSLAGSLGGLSSTVAALGFGALGGDSGDANFVDVLNSRSLRERLLKTEFPYHERTWRFGAERPRVGTLYAYLKAPNMDRAIKKLRPVLTVSRDLKSKVITMSAETRSPELSQLIVQKASSLLESYLQVRGRTRGGAKAAFADARLAESRRELDDAEGLLRQFMEVNRNYTTSTDPFVRLKGARLADELRLRQQLLLTIAVTREQAMMDEKNDMPILNIMDPGNLPEEKSRPARAVMVLLAMMLAGAGSWVWLNQEWVRAELFSKTRGSDPERKEKT